MGERARNIGIEAENKVENFLDALGYEFYETNNEDYNIDCIALTPPNKPVYGLAQPRHASQGLCAFEVREPPADRPQVKAFKKKIKDYNKDHSGADERIKHGVYIVDHRISGPLHSFMRKRTIWGWGLRRQRLYAEKIRTFNEWKDLDIDVCEVPIDQTCSYIRCTTPPPTRRDQILHLHIYIDDTFRTLTPVRVREILAKIKALNLDPLLKLGIKPLNIYIEFHSIGGLSGRLQEEVYKTVIRPWSSLGISVTIPRYLPFKDYRAFSLI